MKFKILLPSLLLSFLVGSVLAFIHLASRPIADTKRSSKPKIENVVADAIDRSKDGPSNDLKDVRLLVRYDHIWLEHDGALHPSNDWNLPWNMSFERSISRGHHADIVSSATSSDSKSSAKIVVLDAIVYKVEVIETISCFEAVYVTVQVTQDQACWLDCKRPANHVSHW